MANPDVDVHAKTWNHREKRKKKQSTENQKNT